MNKDFVKKIQDVIAKGAFGYSDYHHLKTRSNDTLKECDNAVDRALKKEKFIVYPQSETINSKNQNLFIDNDGLLHYTFKSKEFTTANYSLYFVLLCNFFEYRYSLATPWADDSDSILNIGTNPGVFIVTNYDFEKIKEASIVMNNYKYELKMLRERYKNSVKVLKDFGVN